MPRRLLSLVGIGLLGGFLSGMFGIGGGILMVPLIVLILKYDQRRASALSLVAVLPAAIVGSITYGLEGHVDLLGGACIAAGGIVGALIGTRLLRALSLGWLRWGFVVVLLGVAIYLLVGVSGEGARLEVTPLVAVALVGVGVVVGVASGLFGIGGGVIIVPALVGFFGVSELIAKGTSLLAMIPTSITGTIANTRARLVKPADGLTMGVAAAAASFPGALIAHVLPTRLSHVLFAVLVLAAAAQLGWRAWKLRRA